MCGRRLETVKPTHLVFYLFQLFQWGPRLGFPHFIDFLNEFDDFAMIGYILPSTDWCGEWRMWVSRFRVGHVSFFTIPLAHAQPRDNGKAEYQIPLFQELVLKTLRNQSTAARKVWFLKSWSSRSIGSVGQLPTFIHPLRCLYLAFFSFPQCGSKP